MARSVWIRLTLVLSFIPRTLYLQTRSPPRGLKTVVQDEGLVDSRGAAGNADRSEHGADSL